MWKEDHVIWNDILPEVGKTQIMLYIDIVKLTCGILNHPATEVKVGSDLMQEEK